MNSASDQEILDLVKVVTTRDAGFRLLLKTYQEQLYWQIRKMILDHDDTHDVLQNVCVKVFKGIENFRGDSKLSSWLFRIAYNESMTFLNKKSKRMQVSNTELQETLVNNLEADVYFTGDQVQLELQKALAQLPDRQKEIFNLRYYDDIKFKEIASILELSEGAVKSSYHIAAKKITQFINRD